MSANYTAIIQQQNEWWIGWVEEISGVNSQGRTREELIENLRDALHEILKVNRELARAEVNGEFEEVTLSPAYQEVVQDSLQTARLIVSVRPATSPHTFNEIELQGTKEGLIWLAQRIMQVATAAEEYHTHLDREANEPIYQSASNWWITISRSERIRL